jgi:hypothetical protein
LVYRTFGVMQNELGTPKVIICPSDERTPAPSLSTNSSTTGGYLTNNTSLSYFLGVDANENLPQSILSGDRNLDNDSTSTDYGYVKTVTDTAGYTADIATNSTTVNFTDKMHLKQGNVALGDGSVQQVSSARFRSELLKNVDPGSYHSGANPSYSIRLLIP